jgi:hypothetical protein
MKSLSVPLLTAFAVLAGARALSAQTPAVDPKAPSAAPLGDEAELARVTTLYDSGKYAECAEQLTRLLDRAGPRPLRDPQVSQRARIYQAACFVGSGQRERAGEALRAALRAEPTMKPPNSLVFPQAVIDEFFRAQEAMRDEIRKAEARRLEQLRAAARAKAEQDAAERSHLQELKILAASETIIIKNQRSLALVPFGVGQFQNRNPALGAIFLTTEVGLAGAALTSLIVRAHLNEAGKQPDTDKAEVDQRLEDWHLALEISSYAFLGVAVAGIVEAQISFKPEFRETRRRPLPPHLETVGKPSALRITPGIVPRTAGAEIGIRGVF